MVSFKLIALLIVASVYVSSVRSDDEILDVIKEEGQKVKEKIDEATTTESQSLFSNFKEKVGSYYDTALKKGKETFEATADAVSNQYNKVKEKAKEFIFEKEEKPLEIADKQ